MTSNRFLARQRIAALVDRVAADREVARAALCGTDRAAPIVRVRFAVVWIARVGLRASWPEIGRELVRDHTTMMHACRRAEHLRGSDPAFRDLTDRLLAATLENA